MSVGTTLRFWLGARQQCLTRCGAAGQWRHAEPVRATVLWGSADGSVAAGLGIDPDAQREVDRERGRL